MKGQVCSVGLPEIARRCVNVFEANVTPMEFCEQYEEQSIFEHYRERPNYQD